MSKLHIMRDNGSIADSFRPYRVIIDGVTAGKVSERGMGTFEVALGVHSVRLAAGFYSSVPVKVHVSELGCALYCRSTTRRLFGLSLFKPGSWIQTAVREDCGAITLPQPAPRRVRWTLKEYQNLASKMLRQAMVRRGNRFMPTPV